MDSNRERIAMAYLRKNCWEVYTGMVSVINLEEFINQFIQLGGLELATKTEYCFEPDLPETVNPVTGVEAVSAFQTITELAQLFAPVLSQITSAQMETIRALNMKAPKFPIEALEE